MAIVQRWAVTVLLLAPAVATGFGESEGAVISLESSSVETVKSLQIQLANAVVAKIKADGKPPSINMDSAAFSTMVHKALDPPQCAATERPVSMSFSFVVHGVGPCIELYALLEKLQDIRNLQPAIKQIIVLSSNGCETALERFAAETVDITHISGRSEIEAFAQGMTIVSTDIACLIRDDESPVVDPLWVSHMIRIFSHNKALGMATCASGTNMEKVHSFPMSHAVGAQWCNEYQDVRHGDDCCASYNCGSR
jgi:hypothetical protein